eukprot:SAG11_NODE_18119_length_499_cov_1.267500_1_plen_74_part_10
MLSWASLFAKTAFSHVHGRQVDGTANRACSSARVMSAQPITMSDGAGNSGERRHFRFLEENNDYMGILVAEARS